MRPAPLRNDRAHHVLDERLAGRLDHAEDFCRALMQDFRTEAEGIDRLSMVMEQRGQPAQALQLLRCASEIAHSRADDYDADTRSLIRQRSAELALQAYSPRLRSGGRKLSR